MTDLEKLLWNINVLRDSLQLDWASFARASSMAEKWRIRRGIDHNCQELRQLHEQLDDAKRKPEPA